MSELFKATFLGDHFKSDFLERPFKEQLYFGRLFRATFLTSFLSDLRESEFLKRLF